MEYRIVDTEVLYIVGVCEKATFNTNGQVTQRLAKQFMPRLKDVLNRKDDYTLSLQNYERFNFSNFSPDTAFEKWIGVEVSDIETTVEGLKTLTIDAGKYLVIDFKGSIPEFIQFWQNIHASWLPNSKFELDDRPHFERLPSNYNPLHVINEEEIWIPIK